jgi:serine/threonine protein kinase
MRPGDRVGKYVLESRLGAGGMAEVWAARAEGPRDFVKPVALKFILPSFSRAADYGALFFNEAKVAAQLHHANLVSVIDFDEITSNGSAGEGRYFIAMERVEGRDLAAVLHALDVRGERLPEDLVLFVIAEVLEGLRYLHERGRFSRQSALVHRDLSPHNVLVSYSGEIKISDFGIAKLASAGTTANGQLRGKLQYLAPELLAGIRATPQTDQFAAGIVLWEMLSGRRLFAGATDIEILEQVRACRVPPTGDAQKPAAPAIDAIVRRMLARSPEDRFPTTAACAMAVADLAPRAGSGSRLSELMLSLFPLQITGDPAPRIEKTGTLTANIRTPEHAMTAPHADVNAGVADTVFDMPRIAGNEAGTPAPSPAPPEIVRTQIIPELQTPPPGPELAPTRTFAHDRPPSRLRKLPRHPDYPVERMQALYDQAERQMRMAIEAGRFAGDFDAWMMSNAMQGRDALTGMKLPGDWARVARWPRFTDVGWVVTLHFNWLGTVPWGDDGFWVAEDPLADEMMVIQEKDLARPVFHGVTEQMWLSWWRLREVDARTELPGHDKAPMSRRARAILGQEARPPRSREEWQEILRTADSRDEGERRVGSASPVPLGATARQSFWQKLTRLSRGDNRGDRG